MKFKKDTYELPTWKCACGYKQDFKPSPGNMQRHHQSPVNRCPECKEHKLDIETDKENRLKYEIIQPGEIKKLHIKDKETNEHRKLNEEETKRFKLQLEYEVQKIKAIGGLLFSQDT